MSEVVVAVLLLVGLVAAVAVVVGIGVVLPHLQQGQRAKRWAAGPTTRDGVAYYPNTRTPGSTSSEAGDAAGDSPIDSAGTT